MSVFVSDYTGTYVPGMKTAAEIVTELMAAKVRQREIAQAVGVEQPTITRWKKGGEIISANWESLKAFAVSKGVDLYRPGEKPPLTIIPGSAAGLDRLLREIKVVGQVGAGEQVFAFDESMGEQETVEAPASVGKNAVAVRVKGDSMYPELDDEDVLVYEKRFESNFHEFVGRRLIISLQDGRQFVKRLKKGSSEGLYTLVSSNPRERDIEDVTIEWVAPIAWIKPRW